MKYTGITCPACNNAFSDNDDVVVCPECGTPMHRECYNRTNDCINRDKHSENYEWKPPFDPEKERKSFEDELKKQAEATENYGEDYRGYTTGENGSFTPQFRVIGPDEKLGDYTVKDYGEVIQTSKEHYIPNFFMMEKTKRKVSWNWAAFFFTGAWLAYRKMYKEAILCVILSLIVPLCFMGDVYDYYKNTYSTYVNSVIQQEVDDEEIDNVEEESVEPPTALIINQYIGIFIQLMLAIFGNYIYKLRCEKILAKSKALEDGTKTDVYRMAKGGTSVASVILIMLLTYMLIAGALVIYTKTGTDLASSIWRIFKK